MTVRGAALATLALALASSTVQPPSAHAGQGEVDALAEASRLVAEGAPACPGALAIVNALIAGGRLVPVERAEAHRLQGLCLLARGARDPAAAAFLAFLRLEPDGHLDPALVPPEAVALLEQVRATHAAELRAARPRPRARRSVLMNLLPPLGQFQNGETTKGLLLGGAELALLGVNVGTYIALRNQCHDDGTCDETDRARTLKGLNIASGALFIGAVVYGIIDGYVVLRRLDRRASETSTSASAPPALTVGPGGAALTLTF